jgi:sugar (pentulose or hexulose) kinase
MALSLGLDFGTTSISVAAVAEDGQLVERVTRPHRAELPGLPAGHAEQSPQTLLETALGALSDLSRRLADRPFCLGLTGQMHGLLLVDAKLQPLTNLITWQDKRALDLTREGNSFLDQFRMLCDGPTIERTGCTPSPGYLAVTLFAIVHQNAFPANARHALLIADWAAARFTGTTPVTDRTNAASTGGYDLQRDGWSELLDSVRLPRELFPPVVESGAIVGRLSAEIAARAGLPEGLSVAAAIGDHQAAVLGSLPAGEHAIHVNIGTGGQVSLPIPSFTRTATSETRYLPDHRYLLVGAGMAGGDAYAWVQRTVGNWFSAFGPEWTDDQLFETIGRLAADVPTGCDGLRCEPFFRGTRREPGRRGVFRGVSTENFTPGHVARAVLEGIADALAEFVRAHETSTRQPLTETGGEGAKPFHHSRLIATGNAVRRNPLLANCLANAFRLPVFVPEHEEEAAYGAAILAGVRAGLWPSLEAVGQCLRLVPAASVGDGVPSGGTDR